MPNSHNYRRYSLKNLLFVSFAALLFVLLTGNFIVNITNASDYLEKQLGSHAQDAATSLGLSLSTVIDGSNLVAAGSMMDAFFDSGDYRHVVFYDVNNKPLIERSVRVEVEGVPEWFVQLVALRTPVGDAEVLNGWQRLGRVEVISHPGYANTEMWNILKFQLMWFALVGAIGYLVLRYLLSRVLNPLQEIEFQAKQIGLNNFDYSTESPMTEELYQVATAMNAMSRRLSDVFKNQLAMIDQLRDKHLLDGLTGMLSREGFDARLKSSLESQQDATHGCLFITQIKDFEHINADIGRAEGDELLIAVSDQIKGFLGAFPQSFSARRGGANFCVFIPGVLSEQSEDLAKDLLTKLLSVPLIKQRMRDDLVHIGMALTEQNERAGELLSKGDLALRQAQSLGQHGWKRYVADADSAGLSVREAGQWHQLIQVSLQNRSMKFLYQPVFRSTGQEVLFYQVLSRLEDDGQLIEAAQFIPMADRFGLMYEIDRLILELSIETLLSHPQDANRYCLSISDSALSDQELIEWLTAVVQAHGQLNNRIVFELQEYAFKVCEESVIKFASAVKQAGFAISIARFGAAGVPFSYLEQIDADFIKVDQSIVRDIDKHPDNQFFLRTAVQIAHSQSIKLLVGGIETEAELNTMKSLGVDGVMGYYLARPLAEA